MTVTYYDGQGHDMHWLAGMMKPCVFVKPGIVQTVVPCSVFIHGNVVSHLTRSLFDLHSAIACVLLIHPLYFCRVCVLPWPDHLSKCCVPVGSCLEAAAGCIRGRRELSERSNTLLCMLLVSVLYMHLECDISLPFLDMSITSHFLFLVN